MRFERYDLARQACDCHSSKLRHRALCMIWLVRILHFLLGGIFVYAGVMKALRPLVFLDDVRSFDLLPDPYAALLAMFLPWLEIFAGLAVITGCLRKGGLLLLSSNLLVFLIAIGIAWAHGTDIRCGCFGGDVESSRYLTLIVRDLLLLALAMVCLFWRPFTSKLPLI